MIAIGETLRRERLRRNLGLQEISEELKLSTRFLEAMETDQFDRLPGGVFTKSFVRQYARYLGLDEEGMAAEVARLVEPPPDALPVETKPHPSVSGFPLPPDVSWDRISDSVRVRWPNWLPGLALVVVVTLICSGGYVWWQRAERASAHAAEPRTSAPVQSTPVATPLPAVVPEPSAEAAPTPAPVSDAPPQTAAPKAVAADAGAPLHVELTSRKYVWVRASSNGKILFTVTMAPNETRSVDATGSLEVRLGNAGGVDISLNGKSIGAVGPEGQIRTVQLTPGGFNIVAPPPKPAAPADPL